jgi:alpha-1,6-mannosyltransferase
VTICDLSPFYCNLGGGIRTYHRARIEWFRRQTRHRYVLISPGPAFGTVHLGPAVSCVRVYGPQLTRQMDGYRLLLDYPAVRRTIMEIRPDVLEVQDLWLSAPLGLLMRKRGEFQGHLTSFCHSEPLSTYIEPFLERVSIRGVRHRLTSWARRGLALEQRQFDLTLVASETIRARMQLAGVRNVVKVAFGVDPALLALERPRPGTARPRRLLYAGRLDDDKEFRLVLDVLPDLLRRPDVSLTVMGSGKHRPAVSAVRHPRFQYLGFVDDPAAVRSIYASHDILLAPGRFETFGLAALEAAAAGLVVVGPQDGGTAEILRQMESPLSFRSGERAAFLDRVLTAIDGDISVLSRRGRTIAGGFGTWPDAVARPVAVYESMVAGNG